jgi:hypothetical protein
VSLTANERYWIFLALSATKPNPERWVGVAGMPEPLADAQPGTVPWGVMRVPFLPSASIFPTSVLASGNGPRVVGGASEAAVVDPGVVVGVELVVDTVGATVPEDADEPQPATASAIVAAAARGTWRIRLDKRENIAGSVCRETEPRAKP